MCCAFHFLLLLCLLKAIIIIPFCQEQSRNRLFGQSSTASDIVSINDTNVNLCTSPNTPI